MSSSIKTHPTSHLLCLSVHLLHSFHPIQSHPHTHYHWQTPACPGRISCLREMLPHTQYRPEKLQHHGHSSYHKVAIISTPIGISKLSFSVLIKLKLALVLFTIRKREATCPVTPPLYTLPLGNNSCPYHTSGRQTIHLHTLSR